MSHAFCFLKEGAREGRRTVAGDLAAGRSGGRDGHGGQARETELARQEELAAAAEAERKTLALPAILSPVQFPGRHLPKPTPVNLRRFAETPVVRRAINVIKDRIAAMDWQVRVRRGVRPEDVAFAARKLRALRRTLEEPNAADSFRTLIEQVDRGRADGRLRGHRDGADRRPGAAGDAVAGGWGLDPDQRQVGRRRRIRRAMRRRCRGNWSRAQWSCSTGS